MLLFRDFRPRTHYCQAADCVYSLRAPGETAWARKGACYCSWCDGETMAMRKKTFRDAQWIVRSLNIYKAADEAIFAQAWGKLSKFFQTAPQRAEERRRQRRDRDVMASHDHVRRYPAYVEPTARDRLLMKEGPRTTNRPQTNCIVCGLADRRLVIREYESQTGDIESVQERRQILDTMPLQVL